MASTSAVLDRIHKVRKIKGLNLHDCAAFLNLSKKDYLHFEQGSKMLSLPEIELLALLFGVSPTTFFDPDQWEKEKLALLDDHLQPQFINLRDKMIQAVITQQMKALTKTPETVSSEAGIPLSDFIAYHKGNQSIPLDHLLKICKVLELSAQDLIEPFWLLKSESSASLTNDQWQREYTARNNQDHTKETPYDQLAHAFNQLPKKDQAEVAKILLNRLQKIQHS